MYDNIPELKMNGKVPGNRGTFPDYKTSRERNENSQRYKEETDE